METIILFGASKLGQIAYMMLSDDYEILCFSDNDPNKWGKRLCGLEIVSPNSLKNFYKQSKILITSTYYEQILQQLQEMNINNYEVYRLSINMEPKVDYCDKIEIKQINLGEFLSSIKEEIVINDYASIPRGGSGVLDYAFIKALVLKLKLRSYLEIGTFIGESIACIANLVDCCYSITLPDDCMDWIFKNIEKNNFSRYFAMKAGNVQFYLQDSKNFDFSIIKEKIDLVFIDGDHSYMGIFLDTKNIFENFDIKHTIVVWHDFKQNGRYRMTTVNAIFDAVPQYLHSNIFSVDTNLCGIYIPEKFLAEFNSKIDYNRFYSYQVSIKPRLNQI